jgi:hypothetical protein
MNKTKIKQDKKHKHIKYTKLSPIMLKQYLPQWSRHSVARQKISAASAGDFLFVMFCLDWFVGVAT